ncbi:CBS domain-containing protein [Nocardiopsis sp. YSL2]|uniref:CBS domain-containing protein n=1 Tax=Nocardiopsis sp. YSL2 TaxID=2939492 RepID=UPI0026F47497|nr:CBS domain-containing protein [Nocardiopsis sp. YSL2]
MNATTVGDVMTREVFSVSEDTGYREIVKILLSRRVSALPVTDRSGRVVGVVSEDDLLHKEEFAAKDAGDSYWPPVRAQLRSRLTATGLRGDSAASKAPAVRAGSLMTRPAMTADASMTVIDAARSMERRGVKRLPVVDHSGVLVGIVDRRDLLSVYLREDDDIARAVDAELGAVDEDVAASVEDGVVTLTGWLRLRSTAEALVDRVRRIEGVVSVEDRLVWRSDDVLRYVRRG